MAAGEYYTQAEYADRYGADELVRLTDESGNGQVDADAVAKAIADASADMDAYLGTRYTLPIAEPHPRLLKSIAAPLVREKLHGLHVPEAVETEANRARTMLKDLSAGRATLTVDATGEQSPGGQSGQSGIRYTSGRDSVFGAGKLEGF